MSTVNLRVNDPAVGNVSCENVSGSNITVNCKDYSYYGLQYCYNTDSTTSNKAYIDTGLHVGLYGDTLVTPDHISIFTADNYSCDQLISGWIAGVTSTASPSGIFGFGLDMSRQELFMYGGKTQNYASHQIDTSVSSAHIRFITSTANPTFMTTDVFSSAVTGSWSNINTAFPFNSLYLFANNNDGEASGFLQGTIKVTSIIISDQSGTLRNYIPVYTYEQISSNRYNSQIGFYEIITKTFHPIRSYNNQPSIVIDGIPVYGGWDVPYEATITANSFSSNEFLGWFTPSGELYSNNITTTVQTNSPVELIAVFSGGSCIL